MLGEDFDFVLDAGPAVVERVDEFLEIEQPERQLSVAALTTLAREPKQWPYSLWPSSRKMRRFGPGVEDLVEDHRDAARLSDAGRTENGEMLAEQIVDVDAGGNGFVVMQRADVDRAGAEAVDEPEFVAPMMRAVSPIAG